MYKSLYIYIGILVFLFYEGAINVKNNGKIQSGVTDALEPYGVTADRIYLNFFDMPRENVGWNRSTFGG